MNNFKYENNGTNTYLVYELNTSDYIDSMSLGMITNNKISGLAQTIYTQIDTKKYVKYNVSSKVTIKDFFSGTVNKKRLIGVFRGIVDSFISAEEYMLDASSLVLDIEYIFVDVSTCEVNMICLPVLKESRSNVEIREFFRELIYAIKPDLTEDCSHVARIMSTVNEAGNFSLADFKKVLMEIDGISVAHQPNPAPSVIPAAPVAAAPMPMASPAPSAPVPPAAPAPIAPSVSVPVAPATVVPVPVVPKVATPPAASKMPVPPKNGMAVPPKATNAKSNNTVPVEGQEISLFYLLQHYNSDNAAAYKAQQAAKKAQKGANKGAAPAKPAKSKGKKPQAAPAAPAAPVMPGAAVPPAVPVVPVPAAPVVPGQAAPVQAQPVAPVAPVVPGQAPYTPAAPAPQPMMQPQGATPGFGETTVLGKSLIGETTVLNAAGGGANQPNYPILVRMKNHETVTVTKNPFRIGKDKNYVDFFIGDNTAISRSHAEITSKDGVYYVKDTNSTNHTYVNNTMIQSGVEVKLNSGDHLRFGNEEFEFRFV